MRKIKFRAWDKKEKRMTYLGRGGEDILYFDGEEIYWTRNHDGDDWQMENFELMQYTGLKDKNGKEIFEGDIVKQNIEGDAWVNEVVEYSEGGYNLVALRGHWNKYLKEMGRKVKVPKDLSWLVCVEVLGNIYENPELLK